MRTYIQSGNVVFQADSELASRVAGLITESIADRFGYTITVIQRSATELLGAVRANPFAHADAEIGQFHAVFLACAPSPALVDGLDPDRSPGDSFTVVGREIFLHCPRGCRVPSSRTPGSIRGSGPSAPCATGGQRSNCWNSPPVDARRTGLRGEMRNLAAARLLAGNVVRQPGRVADPYEQPFGRE